MNKTRIVVLVMLAATVVLSVVAVGAYAAKTVTDSTPPVTTSTVTADYVGDVAFDLQATDADGVAYVYYRLDKNKIELTVVPTDTVHSTVAVNVSLAEVGSLPRHPQMVPLSLGSHTLLYWAQDTKGNVEAQNSATFVVHPALTLARESSVVAAGKSIKLSGSLKPGMAADIQLEAKKPGAKTFEPIKAMASDASGAYSTTYKTRVKGTWTFRSSYVDVAQELSGTSATVKVRVK